MRRLYLPRAARHRARNALTQQCWCWGQDIRRPEGNALLQFGFAQHRPPENEGGASMYFLNTDNCSVALWGFGLFFGRENEGVFLPRFCFEPRLCRTVSVPSWLPSQVQSRVPQTPRERIAARRLTSHALAWIESYETWALQTFGDEYRCRCLEVWSQPFVPPREALNYWPELARECLRGRA